jgi:hypothetical protein
METGHAAPARRTQSGVFFMLEHFALALAAHATFDISRAALVGAFRHVVHRRPDLENVAKAAAATGNPQQVERVFAEAVGVIIAEADGGTLSIDGATLAALKGIRFDHQHGRVAIGDSVLLANVLVTGGSLGATGETEITGNTSLRSRGTKVEVGRGASIVMTGGASMKQT